MLPVVLEGRRIAPGASRGRKVRTPLGAMPHNPSPYDWDTYGRFAVRRTDGKCHRKQTARRHSPEWRQVMVKRCGKSAPREAQATRHGKPHRVQDQIGNPGAARSGAAKAAGFRVLVAETNDSLRRKAQTEIGLQPFQNQFPPPGAAPQGVTVMENRIIVAPSGTGWQGTSTTFNIQHSTFNIPRLGDRGNRAEIRRVKDVTCSENPLHPLQC